MVVSTKTLFSLAFRKDLMAAYRIVLATRFLLDLICECRSPGLIDMSDRPCRIPWAWHGALAPNVLLPFPAGGAAAISRSSQASQVDAVNTESDAVKQSQALIV